MLSQIVNTNFAWDWGAVGLFGGAIYGVYQTVISSQIKSAVQDLKLTIQDRFATVEKDVAVNFAKHLSMVEDVRNLQNEMVQIQKDIAFRDGLRHSSSGG